MFLFAGTDMKILLIVPFIGMVLAAPVAEDEKSIRPIGKNQLPCYLSCIRDRSYYLTFQWKAQYLTDR